MQRQCYIGFPFCNVVTRRVLYIIISSRIAADGKLLFFFFFFVVIRVCVFSESEASKETRAEIIIMSSKKLVKFVILFDNTSLLYFPGQFLSGRVIVELNDETSALGMCIIIITFC